MAEDSQSSRLVVSADSLEISEGDWLAGLAAIRGGGVREAEHVDPDGNRLVDVQQLEPDAALSLLTSPYDRAAVVTWINERTHAQEADRHE